MSTYFGRQRIPFKKFVWFLYGWAWEMTSVKWCKRELQLSKPTVVDWSNFLRDACIADLATRGVSARKIGGPGTIVEVDESMFTRRKSNAGCVLPQQWVFGGICRETKEVFVEAVDDVDYAD